MSRMETPVSEQVRLTIDGIEVSVPAGTLLVDAAKQAGVYIPVFCYHPKLDPVGMCRMCLVEVGRPRVDRSTGELARDEAGDPIVEFSGALETACTTPVGEGWVVRAGSPLARGGQKQIVEYLLTSHPLDCPICDKGGECPLQELTMDFGAGKSRFLYDDKIDLQKAYPLGDLIFLDRERCIQCARCTRYQEELVGDPVLSFEERGRRLQIVTYSDPGFDSYFSGNTTDICPVGALTTADFRFEARPWELNAAASICPHCPVGCNTVLNTRRQPNEAGRVTVQRVMPRQNEAVNEIWICDKGRFAHHYAGSEHRLSKPQVRGEDGLAPATWPEALERAVEGLQGAEGPIVGIAGGRASNEDLFNFQRLLDGLGGTAYLYDSMGGGEVVQDVGLAPGTDLGKLAQGDVIAVIAADLHEEAPIWWLRVKRAVDRGAKLIVANGRPTRLDDYAAHALRYAYQDAVNVVQALAMAVEAGEEGMTEDEALNRAAEDLKDAVNLVVFYGSEGLDLAGSTALARACGSLLKAAGQPGQPQNGLIPVWPRGNTQGAWDLGLRPASGGLQAVIEQASAALVLAADPAGDDPRLAEALEQLDFLLVQELFVTPTAERAAVLLPAQSFIEREGTFTSGERRVQRFYPGVQPYGEAKPDWLISAEVGAGLGIDLEGRSAAAVLRQMAEEIPAFAGLTYQALARLEPHWPPVGGEDLYFGGTAYPNGQGVGVQLSLSADGNEAGSVEEAAPQPRSGEGDALLLVPISELYDQGGTVRPSAILKPRIAQLRLEMHPEDAARLDLPAGGQVELHWDGRVESVPLEVGGSAPRGVVLLPRSLGIPVGDPVYVEVRRAG